MKFLKILAVMTLMFSATSQVYAQDMEENGDAPCTAVTTGGEDVTTGVETETVTEETETGSQ